VQVAAERHPVIQDRGDNGDPAARTGSGRSHWTTRFDPDKQVAGSDLDVSHAARCTVELRHPRRASSATVTIGQDGGSFAGGQFEKSG
jgi:hypothetical protein